MIYGDITGAETSTPCEEDGTFSTDVDVKNREEGRSLILEQADAKGNTTKLSVHLGKFVFVLDNIKQIAVGGNHSCVLTNDGEVKCWGRNHNGQLGNHSTTNSLYPVDVHTDDSNTDILSGIEQIAAYGSTICAVTTAGKVKCWGEGSDGMLGNGQTSSSRVPVDVCEEAAVGNSTCPLLSDISAIDVGTHHVCALTSSGNVKCWGSGNYGQLGNNSTTNSLYPVDVHKSSGDNDALENITAIALGTTHTCALTSSGNVKCWGDGRRGQVGNGATTRRNTTPVDVRTSSTDADALSSITAISAEGFHACALTNSGNVKCWGNGGDGILGNGETTNSSSPVDVCAREKEGAETSCPLLDGVKELSAGISHACVLMNNGNINCWGSGGNGRLGNGSTSDSSYPTDVCARKKVSGEAICPVLGDVSAIIASNNHSCVFNW